VIEVADGGTSEWFVEPGAFGLEKADLSELVGGTPQENAAVSRAVLGGERGPRRDLVVLNAAATIYVGGLAGDLGEGVAKAKAAIDSGAASRVLDRLIETSAKASEYARPVK
jgi:anthranilate phosphoribosyltransferase